MVGVAPKCELRDRFPDPVRLTISPECRPRGRGTVHDDQRSSQMQSFTYNFTDFVDFTSPSVEMLLAPHELFQFASVVAQEMLFAVPDLVHKGICVAIYDANGSAVSIAPLGTVH
jgi:hypothetical protein